MPFDILDRFYVEELINEVESNENIERKRKAWKEDQIYWGNQDFYVKERLHLVFPKTYKSFIVANYSLLKKATDKLSQAYKQKPIRTLDNETETEEYNEIFDDFYFDDSLQRMDMLKNRGRYCALWITKEENEETLEDIWRLSALQPYEFDVVKDHNGTPMVYILSYPDLDITSNTQNSDMINQIIANYKSDEGADTKVYALWTKDNHVVVKKTKVGNNVQIQYVPIEDNPGFINPFGTLPFIFVSDDCGPNYPIENPLPCQSVEFNLLLSGCLTASLVQGFGQLIISHPQGQEIDLITSGLFSAMRLPQSLEPEAPPTTAQYINPSPDLQNQLNVISSYGKMVLDEQGVRGDEAFSVDSVKEFTSGFDRLIANANVQEIIEHNQALYSRVECKLYEIIKTIYEFQGQRVFSSETLSVHFQKPKLLLSDAELLDNIDKMLTLGLIEEHEKFMIIDPNLSADQAKEKLKRIEDYKKKKMEEMDAVLRGSGDVPPGAGPGERPQEKPQGSQESDRAIPR